MHSRTPETGPRVYWCIGLYASGSTWLFNAGKKIASACGLGNGLTSSFVSMITELTLPVGMATAIIKTHDTDQVTAEILAAQCSAIWLSLRDPRDCVTSLMTYQDCTFEEALAMTVDAASSCQAVLHHPRTRLFRFEDDFFDDPATLDVIAASFECRLTSEQRTQIYAETRRSAIEAFIHRFAEISTVVAQPEAGHFVDLDTQWHTHHAGRSGTVGRWQERLTNDQIAAVETHLSDAMTQFQYITN